MSSEHIQTDRRFFTRWVRVTFLGYLLGFVFILLGGIVGDLLGLPGSDVIIGIGMGLGIGYAQGRVAREWLGAIRPWVWTTVIGLGGLLLAEDLVAAVWSEFDNLHSLQLDVAISGLLVGLLQRRILRSHFDRANWWVPVCVVGWTLAAWTASVTPAGGQNAFLNLGMILSGGVVLGVVTGGALVWMLRR
jgi:hypothetical protein